MSKRSQAAWRLSLDLAGRFGLRPGAVEVRWDQTRFPGGYRWGWLVSWADGPTVEQMRAAVQELAGDALTSEVERGLAYHRGITPLAWAVQLIAVTQGGEGVADVDDPVRWQARLEATPFPERAADPEQQRLAALLVDAAAPHNERHFGRVLAQYGLAGLAAYGKPDPAIVVPLARGRRRRRAPPGRRS
jgi:hypothetical protein